MTKNIQRGMFRLVIVLGVLWTLGMGWYQYQESRDASHHELNIQFTKDAGIHMQAETPENRDTVTQRWLWVLLPPLALMLLFPVSAWLARGFKPEGQ